MEKYMMRNFVILGLVMFMDVHGHAAPTGRRLQDKLEQYKEKRSAGNTPTDERQYMPLDEMDDFVWKKFQELSNKRSSCSKGDFWMFITMQCESCQKYCPGGYDMTMCGPACLDYYQELQIKEQDERLGQMNTEIIVGFVSILLCLLAITIGVAVKMKAMEKDTATNLREQFEEATHSMKKLHGSLKVEIEVIRKKMVDTATSDAADSAEMTDSITVQEYSQPDNEKQRLLNNAVMTHEDD